MSGTESKVAKDSEDQVNKKGVKRAAEVIIYFSILSRNFRL